MMGTATFLLFLQVFYVAVSGSFGTTINVLSEVSSSSIPMSSSLTPEASDPCTSPGQSIYASSGHISSPHFPSNYSANQSCNWNITVPFGNSIKLTFFSFTLVINETENCTGAALSSARVFVTNVAPNGGDNFQLCGQNLPDPVYSEGNFIQVRFESRDGPVNKGFNATFEAIYGDLSVSNIQSTPSLTLHASMSAIVPSPSRISATETVSGSFGTTVNVSSEVSSSSIPVCKCHCGFGLTVSAQSASSSYDSGNFTSYSSNVSSTDKTQNYATSSYYTSYSAGVSAQNASLSCDSGNLTSCSSSVSSTNKTQNYATTSYYISSSVTYSVCYCPCGTSTSAVNAISSSLTPEASDPVSNIQSTPSLTLHASMSAIVPAAESTSQSHGITPSVTPSIRKSLSSSFIEHVTASQNFSSHEPVRTSSSLTHARSASSIEASRTATPSSVVYPSSLCECPCDIRSTFLAEKSSSVFDSGSLSSFTYGAFGQTSSILAESSWSVYDLGSHSSFASSVFGQLSSALAENSRSVYDSEGFSSFASSAFAESYTVSAENAWSVYGSENPSSSAHMVFEQNASVSAEKSWTVYDLESSSSSTSMGYVQNTPGSAIAPTTVHVSESLSSSSSTGLMQDISSDSGSRTSSSSSVVWKMISPSNTYSMSSPLTPSVCYCPCSTSTIAPSPSSTFVAPTPTPSVVPPASNMYPYGPQQKDNEFGLDDTPYYYSDHCLRINVNRIGIPFFSKRHYKLYICRNGIIQLDYEWSWWWPRRFGIYRWFNNMGIIAPFWATTDTYFAFKYNNSKVYYQVYSQNQKNSSEILDLATRDVKNYTGGFGDFEATWVLVVTWEKLCPYSYHSYYYRYGNEKNFQLDCPRNNTFQAVLITNGFNAFLMYNYPSKGIQWLLDADPDDYRYWTDFYGLPVAGWNAGDDGKNFENLKGSGTFGLIDIDKKVGNTGLVGRNFWRIENSDGQGARKKCFGWVTQNEAWKVLDGYNELIKSDPEMSCPCTEWQAWLDWGRFRWNWWKSWPEMCYESRRSKRFQIDTTSGSLELELRQKCCYSTQWEDWGSLKLGPPDGGRVTVTFSYDSSYRSGSFYNDEQAHQSCCVDLGRCDLFYGLRPSDSCSKYIPPVRRWFWGDPHIKTLDDGNYTFNGLGEYIMVDAQNGTFQLQARTKPAQGNSTTATIFSAGAAKEENSSTIEVRVKDGGGLVILIDSAYYYGYNNLTNQSVDAGGNLSFSKLQEDCLQVSFPSTSSVEFCETKEMMSFVVTLGKDFKNTTKGLLGTWNDNPKDDFTLPNGTVLSASLSLREIHFDFGVKWQINQLQSLFKYADNESVATFSKPDFQPMFADNITWQNVSLRQEAEEQCGDDRDCLFDVASTNDLSIGSATKNISVKLVDDTNKLNNFPPKIGNTTKEVNVTLYKEVDLNITAVDDGAITFRVINKPVGAIWSQSGNVLLFHWNVTLKKFSLTFVATDEQNASAIWSPTIRMCACEHDGQCVEPEEGDAENTDSKFVYLGCVCQGGYTGRFCDADIDACELNGEPCYTGVKCIDLPAPANSSGYECGPCPSGYTGNGAQCVDIDECQSDSPKKCAHKCVNTLASFFCDCNDGFKLKDDRRNCEDIDECSPTSDCMQNCNNTVGSYNCSCREYFETDAADWRKCVAENPCTSDPGCNHVCYEDGNRRAACACRANFELQSDGKTCKDIDECAKELHRCSQACANTEGSYKCSCAAGYELEKDGYGCEDINECLNDDSYECTVENQRCVNTRGSYKCDCVQDTYLKDGKCQALAEGEVPPKRPPPVPRNASEFQKQEAVQFSIQSGAEWDFERDKEFKIIMAKVASDFCEKNRTRCALKDQRRKRRSPIDELYTAEEVNLLPGYPKNSSKSLQVAFYVLQPLGRYIGNISVLPRDTLVAIMIANKSDIEKAIGANISGIEALFKPTTTTESPTAGPAEPADDSWKWIVIGVVTGVVVVIILIGLLIFCARKRKRGVKPITDPPQEDIAAKGYHRKPGGNNENNLESGSN